MKRTAMVLVAVAMMAGCSGGSSGQVATATSAPEPLATTTTAPTTTTEDQSMLLRQWGSAMSGALDDWEETATSLQECAFTDCSFSGSLNVLSASAMSKTVPLVISTTKRDVGDPPAELAPLVENVETRAAQVEVAADAMEGCEWPVVGECAEFLGDLNAAMGAMSRAVVPWAPYL